LSLFSNVSQATSALYGVTTWIGPFSPLPSKSFFFRFCQPPRYKMKFFQGRVLLVFSRPTFSSLFRELWEGIFPPFPFPIGLGPTPPPFFWLRWMIRVESGGGTPADPNRVRVCFFLHPRREGDSSCSPYRKRTLFASTGEAFFFPGSNTVFRHAYGGRSKGH